MNKDAIREIVKDVAARVFHTRELPEDANFFQESEKIDSLMALEYVAELEHRTGITVPNEALPQMTSLRKTVEILSKLQQEAELSSASNS